MPPAASRNDMSTLMRQSGSPLIEFQRRSTACWKARLRRRVYSSRTGENAQLLTILREPDRSSRLPTNSFSARRAE